MTRNEAYRILNLRPGASRDEIIARHRFLTRHYHPDRAESDLRAADEEEMKKINVARDVLVEGGGPVSNLPEAEPEGYEQEEPRFRPAPVLPREVSLFLASLVALDEPWTTALVTLTAGVDEDVRTASEVGRFAKNLSIRLLHVLRYLCGLPPRALDGTRDLDTSAREILEAISQGWHRQPFVTQPKRILSILDDQPAQVVHCVYRIRGNWQHRAESDVVGEIESLVKSELTLERLEELYQDPDLGRERFARCVMPRCCFLGGLVLRQPRKQVLAGELGKAC